MHTKDNEERLNEISQRIIDHANSIDPVYLNKRIYELEWLRDNLMHSIDVQHCETLKLESENARLRQALNKIVNNSGLVGTVLSSIAKKALEQSNV